MKISPNVYNAQSYFYFKNFNDNFRQKLIVTVTRKAA